MKRMSSAFLAALLLASPLTVHAATITIVNQDGAGEGFNDPTPAAPIGGNPGTTVGQQRLNVFTQAASIWGALLSSPIVITVNAQFNVLSCSSNSATLGSAGPVTAHANFTGAEFTNHWYHQALANKLRGLDNDAGHADIQATFNSNIGQTGCLDGSFWYYGFDHNQSIGIDLLTVVLHELGHGLGFSTTTNASNGAYLGTAPNQFPAVWDKFLFDRTQGLHWDEMGAAAGANANRTASAINTGNLVWDGTAVTVMAPQFLQLPRLLVNSPPGIAGTYLAGTAEFGADLTSAGVTGTMVLATDGGGSGSTTDACEAITNAGAVNGKIAIADRGNCTFTQKANNLFNAGAIAIVIANNDTGFIDMSGAAPAVTIPIIMISQANGNTIKAQLGGGVNATVGLDPTVHPGTAFDAGKYRALMYAPNPLQLGSSVSHFDISASPNLLMEPQINGDLTSDLDLTRYLFEDIGWLPRTTTGVPVGPVLASGITLRGAPNPFRSSTTLRINLPTAGMVELSVLDVGGRSVRQLTRVWMPAGSHVIAWDGTDRDGRAVPAGVYLTRLRIGNSNFTQRIVRMQ